MSTGSRESEIAYSRESLATQGEKSHEDQEYKNQ